MKKKILCALTLILLLTGCGDLAKLNTNQEDTITIDATEKIDPTIYLKDVDKNATVNYEIENGTMLITVSKGDKVQEFSMPVQVDEPKVSLERHITVDKYLGYDLEQYINEDEGVSHTIDFDEETGKLAVTFTKGEWSKTIEDEVTVLDSNPINNWPKVYTCCDNIENSCSYTLILNENKSFKVSDASNGWSDTGVYTYDGNNSWFFDYYNTNDHSGTGNYETFVGDICYTFEGAHRLLTCTLN